MCNIENTKTVCQFIMLNALFLGEVRECIMNNPVEMLHNRYSQRGEHEELCYFSEEGTLNCRDLWYKSSSLEKGLNDFGVMAGSRVMLCGNTSKNFVISLFACWKCNSIVFPLNSNIDTERFKYLQSQFNADYFIDLKNDLIISLNDNKSVNLTSAINFYKANECSYPLHKQIDPGVGALCIYTSGSTGEPKGVLLSLDAIAHGALNVVEAFKLKPEDVAFCLLPLTHINGLVTTLLAPLYSKSKVLFYQGSFYEDVDDALGFIQNYKCSWMSAIPMHYAVMNTCRNIHNFKLKLRICRSAAAPLSQKVLKQFEMLYNVPLIETLGMTETAGQIFSNPLPPHIHKPNSIGKPFNYRARLIDNNDNIISRIGEVGELIVKGNSMMLGYLDDTKITDKAFLNGWLKTGDLARLDEDGYYYIEGRKKHMIIFSGVNISLGHIEKLLLNREEINTVACIPVKHGIFGEVFDIVIEPELRYANITKGENQYISEIKSFLKSYLPMQPAVRKIFTKIIPKTPVGKIDRSKLESLSKEL
jgi:oxalate---CoA ligase